MKKLFSSTIFKLIIAVIIGILLGFVANESFMNFVVTVKYILGQLIFFMVPLIILGFVSYSIAKMKDNASKMLSLALIIAYLSSIGAAFFAMVSGYTLIPHLSIEPVKETLRQLPELIFRLDIPPVVSVMTALVLSIMIGLATVWTKSEVFENPTGQFPKDGIVTHQPDPYTHSPLLHRCQFLCFKLRRSHHETITRVPWGYGYCHSLPVRVACFPVCSCRDRIEKKSLAGIEVLRPRLPHSRRHDVIGRHAGCRVEMCQEKPGIKRRCY